MTNKSYPRTDKEAAERVLMLDMEEVGGMMRQISEDAWTSDHRPIALLFGKWVGELETIGLDVPPAKYPRTTADA